MKAIFQIDIKEEGEHWWREIRLFGLLIYSRHDFIKNQERRSAGFSTLPSDYIDIEEEYYEDDE